MRGQTQRLAVVAAVIGALQFSQADGSRAEEAVLAVPTVSLTFSALYIAEDKGFWTQQGLTIKTVSIAGVGAFNSVVAGSSDFAIATAGSLTRAAAKGQRMLAIANTVDRPMMEIVLRKDLAPDFNLNAPIEQRGKLLKGQTIGVDAINSITHGYLKIVAKMAGLDPDKDMTVTPMQPPSMVAALKTKNVSGFAMSQPWTLSVVEDGSAVALVSSPRGDLPEMVPYAYNVILTRPEVCTNRRSVCEKMGKGLSMATGLMNDNPKEALAIVRKRFPQMDEKTMALAFELIRKATPRVPVITEAMFKTAEFYNVESGLVPRDQALTDFSGLFSEQFVK